MKPDIAVNAGERMRLRGIQQGKKHGWKIQQIHERLSFELGSVRYGPTIEHRAN